MIFNKKIVQTAVTADDISERAILRGIWGYFAHDAESLRKAVQQEKTSASCYYGRLTKIMEADKRARFVLDRGDLIFTLFYPTDNFHNVCRY